MPDVYLASAGYETAMDALEREAMKAECPECGWSEMVREGARIRPWKQKRECPKCGEIFELIRDTRIAIHEAGHAVLDELAGFSLDYVTIESDEESFGHIKSSDEDLNSLYPNAKDAMAIYAMSWLAGIVAEKIAGYGYEAGYVIPWQCDATTLGGTRCQCRATHGFVCGQHVHVLKDVSRSKSQLILTNDVDCCAGRSEALNNLTDRTHALLKEHWNEVEILRDALLKQTTVTWEEAADLFGADTDEPFLFSRFLGRNALANRIHPRKQDLFETVKTDRQCDLCAEVHVEIPAEYRSVKPVQDWAGSLLQPPRPVYLCGECYTQCS